MMLRLRNPGGRVPAQLFMALDDLSNEIGDGTLRTTTRQAFQMHGIPKANLKQVIGRSLKIWDRPWLPAETSTAM